LICHFLVIRLELFYNVPAHTIRNLQEEEEREKSTRREKEEKTQEDNDDEKQKKAMTHVDEK